MPDTTKTQHCPPWCDAHWRDGWWWCRECVAWTLPEDDPLVCSNCSTEYEP